MNIRRNRPCFCGSGKRYKHCHGVLQESGLARAALTDDQLAGADVAPAGDFHASEKIIRASQLHEQGRLDLAEPLYEAILNETPDHYDALSGLGALHAQKRNLPAAERLFRRALQIRPDSEEPALNLAAVLCDRGRAGDALPFLDRALAVNPGSADALNNRGCALVKLDRHAEALASFRRAVAITPDDPALLSNLGSCLDELGELDEALGCFETALSLDATHVGALVNKSSVLNRLRRYSGALSCADTAVVLAPDRIEALNNRGIALAGLNRHEEALASYDRALALKPDYAEALSNRGNTLRELMRLEEALASYDRALALSPDDADGLNIRGNVLQDLMRHEEALASYDRALALKPDYADGLFNRGNALRDLKRYAEALASFDRALTLKPDYADVHLNESLCRLRIGDFELGWKKYEWRWKVDQLALRKPDFGKPAWDGSYLDGVLLAWGEQGLGDQILHLGMIQQLAGFARKLMVAVEPRLVHLVQRSFPGAEIVALDESLNERDFDMQVPLGSIAGYLRTSWDDFPTNRLAYLQADPGRSRQLRAKLTRKKQLVCGLSWVSTNPRVGIYKSMRLRDMHKILSVPQVQFVDLQYGDTQVERAALELEKNIDVARIEEIDNFNDLDGVAALISACDVVITVSNTTAHLAGGLGRRVFVMLPFAQGRFWYWHEGRDDSPWYPGARLFRQPAVGDWATVIERVAHELKEEFFPRGGGSP